MRWPKDVHRQDRSDVGREELQGVLEELNEMA